MVFKSNIRSVGWHYWWLAYWEAVPTMKNAHIALKWMEAYSGNLEGARSIINKLLSTRKADVISALLIWEKEQDCNVKFRAWILESGFADEESLLEIEKDIKNISKDTDDKAWS